ncbi:ABC transporter ATP-binding protein [Prevotella sp. P5-64]|uniref:ABC transporter ATP-binding protein n=1 Tax=Prevotella sp. P5-64 TaxID=2024226 RepID=UPI000B9733B3|nr:ABC transporter ATP-binding protein [Prevotella sp. P5-64]OYP65210.1 ABC transporter ATP-binding protein [Prevotella sp. P5-64]
MTAITTNRLTVGYRGHRVVEDISLSLPCGRLVCLLGPNGAGKSTLLRTLCGFQPPIAGTVTISGSDITTMSAAEVARLVSVVLTDRPLTPSLTAAEMVGMGRAPYTGFWGRLSDDDRRLVSEAMQTVGIAPLATRRMGQLSDGELQKVMIAKALAQHTPVIVLDEPTAFLDYPSKVAVMKTLARLAHDEGKTILMSTHDLELAAQLGDELMKIENKHIRKITADEVSRIIGRLLRG